MAKGRPGWFRARLRLLIALGALGALGAFFVWKRLQPLPVTVMPIVRGKAVDAVYATGTVEADDRVNVKAKTNGSIADLLVKEGAKVKKGDLLARIDNPVVTFDLKRGQADLSAATAQAGRNAPQIAALRGQWRSVSAELDMARKEVARVEKLVQSGALPTAQLDAAKAKVAQLEGALAANEAQQRAMAIDLNANAARQAAQVDSLASRVSDTEVRSPIDGVVLAKVVEPGEVVAVNQTLFKIGDVSNLVLEVSVDEADIGRVHDGREGKEGSKAAVSLYAFPNQVLRGRVFEILPDANRERKSFIAKVRLEKTPIGLRSGMSAEVNIIAFERDGSLLAPSEAEASGALWIVRGGVAKRVPVTFGIRDLLRVEVTSGVSEGDLVAIDAIDKLEENKRVKPTTRVPDKMAPQPDKTQPAQTSIR
jgi:HlyD family secretion protein